MKAIVLAGFLLCAVFAFVAAEENARCSKGEDCGEDECCLKIIPFMSAKCKKLKTEGERCAAKDDSEEDKNNVHWFICPCAKGLSCKSSKTEDHGGIISFLDETCQA